MDKEYLKVKGAASVAQKYFTVKFDNKEESEYLIDSVGLFMRFWDMQFNPVETPASVPLWVRCHFLPLDLQHEEMFPLMENTIGKIHLSF